MEDDNHDCMEKIDEVNQDIRDMAPGLEVTAGIVRHSDVLFSAPRMESRADIAKSYHVDSEKALKDQIGSDDVLAQNCTRSLFTCAAHLHSQQDRVIQMTFTEIGQKGFAELVEICVELLGFKPKKNTNRLGLLGKVIPRRRSLSNERKRKRGDNEDDDLAPLDLLEISKWETLAIRVDAKAKLVVQFAERAHVSFMAKVFR